MGGMNFTDNLVLYNNIFTETVSYTFCMESLGSFFHNSLAETREDGESKRRTLKTEQRSNLFELFFSVELSHRVLERGEHPTLHI